MSESESVDEDHWPDMDDPYEWREREGLPTYREREGGTVDGPLTNAVQRNAPQRMNTLTYTDSQGEIVVVDLTTEDETPSQQEVVAMPVDPAIEITFDDALSAVLQVLPDVDPSYVQDRFNRLQQPYTENTIPLLLSQILDEPYPKINPRKRSAATANLDDTTPKEDDSKKIDYININRVPINRNYKRIANDVLCSKFPQIPTTRISQTLHSNHNLYAPTYLKLQSLSPSTYRPLNRPRPPKSTITMDLQTPAGKEVNLEIIWIEEYLEKKMVEEENERRKKQEEEDAEQARELNFKEHEINGGLLECGCCFDECPANMMTNCDDGHLFCLECAKRNAESVVGSGGYVVKCMDVSGCQAPFPPHELPRFASEKMLSLRDKLASEIAIREADIDGFVTCPFCDFGAIVEDMEDKEFRCMKSECGVISCRSCRLESHLPLSCEEYAKDHKLSAKHIIEEAMTAALLQKCNKCQKPFIKLHGCNKMTCTCGNLQCYVCGKNIADYRHFETPGPDGKKCPLHDDSELREAEKVREAQKEATRRVVSEEGVREEDVLVEAPDARKGRGGGRGRGGPLGPLEHGGHGGHGGHDQFRALGDVGVFIGAGHRLLVPHDMAAHHHTAAQMPEFLAWNPLQYHPIQANPPVPPIQPVPTGIYQHGLPVPRFAVIPEPLRPAQVTGQPYHRNPNQFRVAPGYVPPGAPQQPVAPPVGRRATVRTRRRVPKMA